MEMAEAFDPSSVWLLAPKDLRPSDKSAESQEQKFDSYICWWPLYGIQKSGKEWWEI